jgi:hypothetical protein
MQILFKQSTKKIDNSIFRCIFIIENDQSNLDSDQYFL